ncbi:DUF4123 domain-containing protein [Pseudomonas sp. G.S.17]|uniref:DUF4123 domain-containing protein n=1 Tax=Pseudomonas sp. G.S.17 TaxID=3137451 RepID=UPI00311C9D67
MNNAFIQPQQWLNEHKTFKHQLLLIIDTVAAPETIAKIFQLAPIREYVRLFQGTEFESLLEQSPWLVRIDESSAPILTYLLQCPERNWGWIASAVHLDLNDVAQHWRERLVINEDGKRWFYRFQDNQVIARHLSGLTVQQIPLLLGPLIGALTWDGKQWLAFENETPALIPVPFATPWLNIPEPLEIANGIELRALHAWLWELKGEATQQLAETRPLRPWLEEQFQRAGAWGWDTGDQKCFLLEQQLNPSLAEHPAWEPRANETPRQHFARCQRELLAASKGHVL